AVGRALGRQASAAEHRALPPRRAARPAPRRADRLARPRPAAPCLGGRRRASRRGRRRLLRDAEPRGARARRSGDRPRSRQDGLRNGGGGLRLNTVRLIVGKDLTVLRRSPLLLGALIAYPIVIAVLVGLVAGYASSKPRVAWVDEDNVPAVVQVGGTRFHVQTVIDQVAKNVTLVRLGPDEAARQLASGKVVA